MAYIPDHVPSDSEAALMRRVCLSPQQMLSRAEARADHLDAMTSAIAHGLVVTDQVLLPGEIAPVVWDVLRLTPAGLRYERRRQTTLDAALDALGTTLDAFHENG